MRTSLFSISLVKAYKKWKNSHIKIKWLWGLFSLYMALHEKSDVANDIFADYGLSAAWFHEGRKVGKICVQLVDAQVWLVEKGDFGLRGHDWAGQPFWSVCSSADMSRVCRSHPHPVLYTLRKPNQFPPHVDKETSSQPASRIRLQLGGLGAIWQVHPVLYEVCKAVVAQNQRLAVASSG